MNNLNLNNNVTYYEINHTTSRISKRRYMFLRDDLTKIESIIGSVRNKRVFDITSKLRDMGAAYMIDGLYEAIEAYNHEIREHNDYWQTFREVRDRIANQPRSIRNNITTEDIHNAIDSDSNPRDIASQLIRNTRDLVY